MICLKMAWYERGYKSVTPQIWKNPFRLKLMGQDIIP